MTPQYCVSTFRTTLFTLLHQRPYQWSKNEWSCCQTHFFFVETKYRSPFDELSSCRSTFVSERAFAHACELDPWFSITSMPNITADANTNLSAPKISTAACMCPNTALTYVQDSAWAASKAWGKVGWREKDGDFESAKADAWICGWDACEAGVIHEPPNQKIGFEKRHRMHAVWFGGCQTLSSETKITRAIDNASPELCSDSIADTAEEDTNRGRILLFSCTPRCVCQLMRRT